MGAVHPPECENARLSLSIVLDEELSEIEQMSLRAHIGRCEACSVFARELDAFTRTLRGAPLQRPAASPKRSPRRSLSPV